MGVYLALRLTGREFRAIKPQKRTEPISASQADLAHYERAQEFPRDMVISRMREAPRR